MVSNTSSLGQQLSHIDRIKTMQSKMSDYQKQIATGVKYQSFKEYGSDALRIQNYRADLKETDGYLYNIDIAQINIKQMDSSVTESITQATNVLGAISVQLTKGTQFDLGIIQSAAATALQIVQANANTKVGDRFLFAGTDVLNPPYSDPTTATSNFQARVSDWLDGTSTTATFLSGLDTMTDSQLGYSATVQSAKNIYARADNNFEVDYTVKANDEGFKKLITGLNALANMQKPATGDIPTSDEFYDVLDKLYVTLQDGVNALRADSATVASAAQVLETIKTNHQNDKQTYQRTLESTEATDTTDAVVRFQTLQTQLESSYRITSILSQLSLTRFLQ